MAVACHFDSTAAHQGNGHHATADSQQCGNPPDHQSGQRIHQCPRAVLLGCGLGKKSRPQPAVQNGQHQVCRKRPAQPFALNKACRKRAQYRPGANRTSNGLTLTQSTVPARWWRQVARSAPKTITQVDVATAICMADCPPRCLGRSMWTICETAAAPPRTRHQNQTERW